MSQSPKEEQTNVLKVCEDSDTSDDSVINISPDTESDHSDPAVQFVGETRTPQVDDGSVEILSVSRPLVPSPIQQSIVHVPLFTRIRRLNHRTRRSARSSHFQHYNSSANRRESLLRGLGMRSGLWMQHMFPSMSDEDSEDENPYFDNARNLRFGFLEPSYEDLLDIAERLGGARNNGLTQCELSRIPQRNYHVNQRLGPSSCPICLAELKQMDKLAHLDCDHYFHLNCATEWLKRNASCPVCRRKVELPLS